MITETFEVQRTIQNLEVAYSRISQGVATVAVNFFKERFRAQNWADTRTEPWKKRKDNPHWARKKERSNNRAILIKTGRLRRSIRKISVTPDLITIGTDVPYAAMHNNGFRGTITQTVKAHNRNRTKFGVTERKQLKTRTRIKYGRVPTGATSQVRAHTRNIRVNIPRRQFMGPSRVLNTQIERFITAELIRALRQ